MAKEQPKKYATRRPASDIQVLRVIIELVDANRSRISYTQLAARTGYSYQTVNLAVNRLEHDGYIAIERGGPTRPNRYTVLKRDIRR